MSARNVEQEFDALRSDFGKLSADLANLTAALRDVTAEGAHDYWVKLRAATDHANGEAHAAAAALGARGRDSIDAAARHVRDRPLTSVLACFAAGLVIGKLLDR